MESVTNKMLLQRARKVKVTWCTVRVEWCVCKTLSSRLISVRLFGVSAPSDHLLGLLKKPLGGHRCQTDAEV